MHEIDDFLSCVLRTNNKNFNEYKMNKACLYKPKMTRIRNHIHQKHNKKKSFSFLT